MTRLRLAGLGVLLAALLPAPAAAAGAPRASAAAYGVLVSVPGADPVQAAFASAPPLAYGNGGFAYPEDGSAASIASASTSARTGPGAAARGAAEAVVRGVSLFGGEIEVSLVALEASATATQGSATGSLAGSRLEGLVVLGEEVEASPNARIGLGDWGYAVLLEQAVVRDDGAGRGFRGFVVGLHVHVTAEHGGLPAGSEILVGYAEAAAETSPPPQPPAPEGPAAGGSGGGGGSDGGGGGGQPSLPDEPQPPAPGAPPPGAGGPPPIVLDPPPGIRPEITGQGYVFPVYGPASFTDDFAAPRATTGWHHGTDVFASLGAPVLAVADGTLFSVGWNGVGGHRLWLRDRQGNEYYYAHLSAYSPLAFDGAEVRAGDVIGFVGNSGDAAGTPYHLHFEIHPASLLGLGYDGVVNPYPYLLAWYADRDAGSLRDPGLNRPPPRAAAVLLESQDIAAASGLEPGALERAYARPLLSAGARLVAAERPPLVGAMPGFGAGPPVASNRS